MSFGRAGMRCPLIALCLVIARGAGAQFRTDPLPPARVGLTAGVSFARVAGDGFADVTIRRGFVGGASVITPFTETTAFQLEALYAMKGASLRNGAGSTASVGLDYVEIPLMLRRDVRLSNGMRPFAYSGPALNLKVLERDDPAAGEFKTVDVGWVFGGGLAFAAGRRAITIGARYEVGLRNITTVGDTKNRVLSFVASVEVPLPRRPSGATRVFRRSFR